MAGRPFMRWTISSSKLLMTWQQLTVFEPGFGSAHHIIGGRRKLYKRHIRSSVPILCVA